MKFPSVILRICLAAAVVTVCLLGLPARAQPGASAANVAPEVSVHATAPKNVYVGDPFELQIIVRNARNVERPVPPRSAEFDAQDTGGVTNSMTIVNGYVSQVIAYKLAITPRRTGDLKVPPIEVVADGRAYQTNAVEVKVLEPSRSADFVLEVTPSTRKAYVGEPIVVRTVFSLGKRIKSLSFLTPDLPSGAEFMEAPDPRPPGVSQQDPRFIELNVGSEKVTATISQAPGGQRRADQLQFDQIIVPRRPGKLAFGSITARFDAVVGQRAPRFTDGPFPDLDVTDRQIAVSAPYDIEVLPLPGSQPADFSGLVGQYSVTASADPREAAVGEPITLRVTINGPPPLSLIPLLDLTAQPSLSSAFRVPREPALPAMTPVGAMFTYPIRARKPGDQQIPPIELSYFDTAAGKYRIARSEPIRINIRPSTGVDVDEADAEEAASSRVASSPAGRVDMSTLALSGRSFDLRQELRRGPAMALAFALPPMLCAGVWVGAAIHRHRLADPAGRRRRRAVRAARRRLRAASTFSEQQAVYAAVSRTLTDLAADWFNHPAGSLTSRQAVDMLTTHADPAAADLANLLSECDRVRFGGDLPSESVSPRSLIDRTRTLVDRLAGSLMAPKEELCA